MTKAIVLVGGGGHCKACIDVIEAVGYKIVGIVEKDGIGNQILDQKVIGCDNDLEGFVNQGHKFLVTVGQIKSASARIRIFNNLKTLGGEIATVISPSATVSNHSEIGEGTIIMHHVVVNAAASIGVNCIVNSKALIEHDAKIGNHSHISTGAIINGGCVIGDRSFVGSNAVVVQGVNIGNDVIIGAGAVVNFNIPDAGIYAGNPAKKV